MRITGGTFKGRKVNPVNNPAIRPSKSMLREALFSILGPGFCSGKVVADLFSGSGIMALEALSRNAQAVYCVDSDIKSCDLIKKNYKLLGLSCVNTLFHMNASQALLQLSSLGIRLDIIFLDPPYNTPELGVEAIDNACISNVLTLDAVAVLEHRHNARLPESRHMSIWKQKKYGHSMLTFYNHKI